MRSRALLGGAVAGALLLAGHGHAEVRRGPFPQTVLSRNGTLIWYVGRLDLNGRSWGDMDALCQGVPVRLASKWRGPTNDELRTLFVEVSRRNAVATWTELYFSNEAALAPAIEPYIASARLHPQINLITRDVYTYEGVPTSLDKAVRGKMYVVRWFNRWTQPFLSLEKSIRYDPGGVPLGKNERLLCVADVGKGR